jgi:hypothetical protein
VVAAGTSKRFSANSWTTSHARLSLDDDILHVERTWTAHMLIIGANLLVSNGA